MLRNIDYLFLILGTEEKEEENGKSTLRLVC